jgi:hypothetical protein
MLPAAPRSCRSSGSTVEYLLVLDLVAGHRRGVAVTMVVALAALRGGTAGSCVVIVAGATALVERGG